MSSEVAPTHNPEWPLVRPYVVRVREANERWAKYVDRLVASRFGGNQSRLAKDIGVAPSTVNRWLDGGSAAPEHLMQMHGVLGLPVTELFREAHGVELDQGAGSNAEVPSVLEAIEADVDLVPEAKAHLISQYGLLLRVSPDEPDRPPVHRYVSRRSSDVGRRAKDGRS